MVQPAAPKEANDRSIEKKREILRAASAVFRRKGLQATTGRDLGPEEHLRELIRGHVRILNQDIPGSLAHLEVEALEGPWRGRIQDRRDAYEQIYRDVLDWLEREDV